MNAPSPSCPICRGIGWRYIPTHPADFAPGLDMEPCPNCIRVEPMGRSGVLAVVLLLGMLIGLVAWMVL